MQKALYLALTDASARPGKAVPPGLSYSDRHGSGRASFAQEKIIEPAENQSENGTVN